MTGRGGTVEWRPWRHTVNRAQYVHCAASPLRELPCPRCLLSIVAALALPARAADIETPSGTFRFDPPQGYTELSAQEIDAKFGRNGRKPIKVFGNASRGSTVSVTWSQQKLTQAALPQFKEAMENLLPKLTPGLVFNERQLRTIGARRWVYLDSTVPAADTDIRNLMYLSDLGGHMIGVNFNATVAEFASQQDGFEAAAQTLKVD